MDDLRTTRSRMRFDAASKRRLWTFSLGAISFCGIDLNFESKLAAQSTGNRMPVRVAFEPTLSVSPVRKTDSPMLREVSPVTLSTPPVQTQPEVIAPGEKDGDTGKKTPVSYLPVQRPIGQVSIDVRSKPKEGKNIVPEEIANTGLRENLVVHAGRSDEIGGNWQAVRTTHAQDFPYQPLFFEEVNLERYGRNCGRLQPVMSGARFFATIPALPYAMTVHNPNTIYAWNWPYEPGWGTPRVRELPPLQWKAGMVQAGAITGLLFVVP